MTLFDIYDFLKPPLELIDHLERFEAKGQLPASVGAWLDNWRTIRSDQPFPLDGVQLETEAREQVTA